MIKRISFLLICFLLLLAPAAPERAASETDPYTFYLSDAFIANRLVPLDPQTLGDLAAAETVESGGIFSADGSTRADAEYPEGRNVNSPNLTPEEIWIVVRDWPGGAERSRFHPPVRGFRSGLSADGSRLLLQPYPFPTSPYPPPADWYVVDTASGQVMGHVQDADNPCFRQAAHFAPAGDRLYCVLDPAVTAAEEPEPMRIVAFDVASGAKTAELALPELLIGGREMAWSNQMVHAFLEPALALSPDGRRLAIAHAGADKVTLVDAQALTLERTLSLERAPRLWERLFPAVAYAKGEMTGTIRRAVFGPDGRTLYLFTQEVRLVPGQEAPEKRGLRLVDLEQGAVVAEALPAYQIQWVRPAPDGTVYVFGTTDERLGPFEIRESSPSMLWRLHARSLEILATRDLAGYRGGQLILDHAGE